MIAYNTSNLSGLMYFIRKVPRNLPIKNDAPHTPE